MRARGKEIGRAGNGRKKKRQVKSNMTEITTARLTLLNKTVPKLAPGYKNERPQKCEGGQGEPGPSARREADRAISGAR